MSGHRQAAEQLPAIGRSYRDAYDHVQQLLALKSHRRLPQWVFQLDSFALDEIDVIDGVLALAERERRQWRAALHATTELAAIEARDPAVRTVADTFDPDADTVDQLADTVGDLGMASLDHFIGVVNAARAAGCSYVDGAFRPVVPAAGRR